ncbi:MarR family winged helix-turn-helix transcriptional regulator [Alcaligenes sp. SDU_A2]|uniref:MarR family winged helix-turn-helix transcriptional regulator n=1 Tax=Alcaligenes sp. SDU_A2 TaxID=3136634 RepID=UPI002C733834|nr:MarR family transcriptional regulator [Alcaligenes sp.]HRL28281.1 MarR family transcriptional regulator [Alcaligenes sp.]
MIMNDIPASAVADAAPDLESRANSDDHFDVRLWLRLMACTNLVEGEIRSRLRTEHQTTLPRFDLMAQLQRQPAGMKMSELSRHLMVTNGNITGITDQLEKEGLVERLKVATDRRSSLIRLTPKGKRQFRKMAASHEQWLQDMFADLSEKARRNLFEALGELKLIARNNVSIAARQN